MTEEIDDLVRKAESNADAIIYGTFHVIHSMRLDGRVLEDVVSLSS